MHTPFMSPIAYIQAVLGVLLILTILLQHRSAGLSATFGGNDSANVQRRGAELFLFKAGVIMSVAFFTLTVVDWYL
jgi:protein translocase SecG subunit